MIVFTRMSSQMKPAPDSGKVDRGRKQPERDKRRPAASRVSGVRRRGPRGTGRRALFSGFAPPPSGNRVRRLSAALFSPARAVHHLNNIRRVRQIQKKRGHARGNRKPARRDTRRGRCRGSVSRPVASAPEMRLSSALFAFICSYGMVTLWYGRILRN